MSNKKATKRALLTSVMALAMCVVMLVGTTFAWFTDTARTGVNTIKSGTLDIQLLDEAGNNLEGKMLKWQKAQGHEDEEVLWEPGCTYKLQPIVIKNNGNLALKYKVQITGIQGDAKLNDAITWTINDGDLSADHKLAAGDSSELTISGTMKKDAGNEYQGLKIDGIAITVLATQDTVEYDSNGNTYDADAAYPTVASGATINEVFSEVKNADGSEADFTVTKPANGVVIDGQGVTTVTKFVDGWISGDVTIKGVTFMNGVCFTASDNGTTGTVTFEDCTFYACDQSKIKIEGTEYANNPLKNSGDGLCLNIDTKNSPELKIVVKDCSFIGEDDKTLNRNGWKDIGGSGWNPDTAAKDKSRGHAIMINGISGGGNDAQAESVLIENCTMDGIRGHAIQLYTLRMPVTIKNCTINSWGNNAQTAAGTASDAAIRGEIISDSNCSLTLTNNYFGLNEAAGSINHVNVDNFSGNTSGRTAGTY